MLYVVATFILPDGTETDSLFVEPTDAIDDGCVALTEPMSWAAVQATYEAMKDERDRENPHWYHTITMWRTPQH
jgi:hypothetical protein